jgi:hypothetical protein
MMDIFQVYRDAGRTGVIVALAGRTVQDMRNICKEYALDITGSYRQHEDSRALAEYMAHRVKCMAEKGRAFTY